MKTDGCAEFYSCKSSHNYTKMAPVHFYYAYTYVQIYVLSLFQLVIRALAYTQVLHIVEFVKKLNLLSSPLLFLSLNS